MVRLCRIGQLLKPPFTRESKIVASVGAEGAPMRQFSFKAPAAEVEPLYAEMRRLHADGKSIEKIEQRLIDVVYKTELV
jgi:hypothetical protein